MKIKRSIVKNILHLHGEEMDKLIAKGFDLVVPGCLVISVNSFCDAIKFNLEHGMSVPLSVFNAGNVENELIIANRSLSEPMEHLESLTNMLDKHESIHGARVSTALIMGQYVTIKSCGEFDLKKSSLLLTEKVCVEVVAIDNNVVTTKNNIRLKITGLIEI